LFWPVFSSRSLLEGDKVRLLRLLGLLAVLAAAYFAGYLFHQRSLSEFFPSWLLNWVPALYGYTRWLPADLMTVALWLGAGAALGFGLIAPSVQTELPSWTERSANRPPRRRLGRAFLLVSLFATLAAVGMLPFVQGAAEFVAPLWAAAVIFFLAGCGAMAEPQRPAASLTTLDDRPPVQPEASWPLLVLILLVAGFLFSWRWFELPAQIDPDLAAWGLQALALLHGEETALFTATAIPRLAAAPLALGVALSGDTLLGLRLTGLIAGLLTVWGAWLLGCELFRRPPRIGPYGETIEDDGRTAALLAAALLATSTAMSYFARLPLFLEPVAWGVLGLWALVRGLRTGDLLAVGLGGVLHGLALILYPVGLVFPLIALCWWAGVWLLQPGWLRPAGSVSRRRWLGAGWLGGLVVTTAPQVVLWVQTPDSWRDRFSATLLPDWGSWLSLLNLAGGHQTPFDLVGGGLRPLIIALLILAVGNLLLNLDRLAGWALFTWLLVTLVVGGALAPQLNQWPGLLSLLPALALTLAFALDRIRVTLLETAGSWAAQTTTYLLVGLVLWLGLMSLSDLGQMGQTNGAAATYTAQALRTLPPGQQPILVLGERQAEVNWETPVIRFLVGDHLPPTARQTITPTDGLAALPPQSTVILQPEEQPLLNELRQRYPDGQRTVWRDHRGNPMLYLYAVP
jgi:hypothetical protein